MLTPVEDGPAIVACNTCRVAKDDVTRNPDEDTREGALLVCALRAVQAADPRYAGIAIHEMPCMFACAQGCTVHLRAPGKVGYVLGRFTPDAKDARALLDYALHYAKSDHGRVPYRDWPQRVKGHFIVRTPPAGFVVE